MSCGERDFVGAETLERKNQLATNYAVFKATGKINLFELQTT